MSVVERAGAQRAAEKPQAGLDPVPAPALRAAAERSSAVVVESEDVVSGPEVAVPAAPDIRAPETATPLLPAGPASDVWAPGGVQLPPAELLAAGPGWGRIGVAVGRARAPATVRAYGSDWGRFTGWCAQGGYCALPADPVVLADYLTSAAEVRDSGGSRVVAVSTLSRWVAAINAAHTAAGHPSPGASELVRVTRAGIGRMYADPGERRVQRRAPLLTEDIRAMLDTARTQARSWAEKVAERRDSALILLGFAGAFRRSELVALTTADIRLHAEDGLHVRVGRSKTDQTGHGATKALPYGRAHQTCPVCAYVRWRQVLDAWDEHGRIGVLTVLRDTGAFDGHVCREATLPDRRSPVPGSAQRRWVFRGVHKTGAISSKVLSGQAVNPLLARRAAAAGVGADILALLGGHSLRAGFVTQAVRAGADPGSIMRQTGHSTDAMVRLYTRDHAPLQGNAVTRLGL